MVLFRMWMVVLIFGKFYRILIWQGEPETFVLGDVVSWGLLEFEENRFGNKGWKKVGIPDWAIQQVWEKTVRRM